MVWLAPPISTVWEKEKKVITLNSITKVKAFILIRFFQFRII